MKAPPPRTIYHLSTARSWRGGEQQIYNLVKQQKEMGLKPIVWAPKESPLLCRLQMENFPVVGYPHPMSINLPLILKLRTFIKQSQPSILHLHDSHAHTNGLLSTLGRPQPPPIVLHRRVPFPVGQSRLSRWKYNHSRIKRIIGISQKVIDAMQICLRRTDHIRKIYDGIDPSALQVSQSGVFRQEIGANPGDILIAHIGALAPEKGFKTFLQAAAKINDRISHPEKIRFLLVGKGPEEAALKKEAHRMGLRNVIFTGFVENMAAVYSDLDLLLFCPEQEGLGTTVIEAMMAGTPVIATRAGGIPELIRHEREGWLSEIGNADELAEYAIHALQNDQLRKQMVEAARDRSLLFTDKTMAEKIVDVYREIW